MRLAWFLRQTLDLRLLMGLNVSLLEGMLKIMRPMELTKGKKDRDLMLPSRPHPLAVAMILACAKINLYTGYSLWACQVVSSPRSKAEADNIDANGNDDHDNNSFFHVATSTALVAGSFRRRIQGWMRSRSIYVSSRCRWWFLIHHRCSYSCCWLLSLWKVLTCYFKK